MSLSLSLSLSLSISLSLSRLSRPGQIIGLGCQRDGELFLAPPFPRDAVVRQSGAKMRRCSENCLLNSFGYLNFNCVSSHYWLLMVPFFMSHKTAFYLLSLSALGSLLNSLPLTKTHSFYFPSLSNR